MKKTGKPMVGVNIVVQHTISGTTTDAAGKFVLPVKQVPAHLISNLTLMVKICALYY